MTRQKAIIFFLFITALDTFALYTLAHTRSLLSFIILSAVMAIAIWANVWYDSIDDTISNNQTDRTSTPGRR
jgi:MFS-type transporter involved in bile tolerance (Atg22 family)